MEQKQKGNPRKKAAAAISAAMVAALLLAGTYAWVDYDQHKTSEYNLDAMNFRVTLNEDFEEKTGWNLASPEVNQDITVTNTGFTDGTYGNVYVRVQLREYFEVVPVKYTFTPDRYMVAMPKVGEPGKSEFVDEINAIMKADGIADADLAQFGKAGYDNFVCFASEAGAQGFLDALAKSRWKNLWNDAVADRISDPISALHDVERDADSKPILDAVTDKPKPITRFYIKTTAKDPNGQYGKHIPLTIEPDGNPQVYTTRTDGSGNVSTPLRASADAADKHDGGAANCVEWSSTNPHPDTGNDKECPTGQTVHDNGECAYLVHLWESDSLHKCDMDTHKYIEWGLGAEVISVEKWKTDYNSKPVPMWIVDTASPNGWVYWGQALKPGETTTKLTDYVTLIEQADGESYYSIHADMEAVDLRNLNQWTTIAPNDSKAPQDLIDGITGTVKITLDKSAVDVSSAQPHAFKAAIAGTDDQALTWAVGGNTQAGTTISADGVLTIDPGEPGGTQLTITATHTASKKYVTATAKVVATVDSVTITDPTSVSLAPGDEHIFAATVVGTHVSQAVEWKVEEQGGGTAKSTIDADGKLRADADDAGKTLTVTATAKDDPAKFATATVTVSTPVPAVTVAIKDPTSVTLDPGDTHQFEAIVKENNMEVAKAVSWSVAVQGGGTADSSIAADGTLTAHANDTGKTLVVTAAVTDHPAATATATAAIN